MLLEANEMKQRLYARRTETNLSEEVKRSIQNILIKVMFGNSTPEYSDKQLLVAIDTIVKGLFPQFLAETIGKGKLKHLFFLQNRQMGKAIDYFVGYVNSQIEQKQSLSDSVLLSMLIQGIDNKTGYSMSNDLVKDEAVTLFLAGQDTTINTLVWFFYLIGKNETLHKRISNEIREHANNPLNMETIEQLKLTKAALYETLRLYPQAIALSRDASSSVSVGGNPVAAKTTVIMNIYAAHRDPTYWKRPNEFYPEHFLNESEVKRHKYTFMPFGGGIHNCIGRHFAELEMMIIIATLLREFTVTTKAIIKSTVSITLKPDRDLIVNLIPIDHRSGVDSE